MKNTVERFSDRVENYVKYRPSYPPEMIALFRSEMRLAPASAVADIGSGTGLSARPFLEYGCRVYGVEPNAPMRRAAAEYLRDFANFESIDGTAERTGLPDVSVDLVIAAQAFHWFDRTATPAEFRRILRPAGFVALVWNERRLGGRDFLGEYEEFLKKYGTDYEKVRHDRIDRSVLAEFFGRDFSERTFPNAQALDFDGLQGRMLSSSYMPSEASPVFETMIAELRGLFDKYAERGKIQLSYDTNIFYTRF